MTRLATGAQFGPYVIEGFLGGGGMGQVYAARHTLYGSVVALKVLHARLHEDEGWRFRFNEEGLVGTRLKHPHVLSARELVEHDGRVALVLDLVRGGQTLQRIMVRDYATGLPLSTALRVMLGIVQGVEYLHERGIVHGDIKPENVLIEGELRDPEKWVPRVTDFGTVGLLARPVLIGGRPAVVASPRYATPEHFFGTEYLEIRSDIYSLGLLLYFLVTGQHASNARSVEEASVRVHSAIPAVGVVDVPESVIAIIQSASDPDIEGRFNTCRQLALSLRDALDELGVTLDLDDLQGDLATEVMEERVRLRAATQATEAELSELDVEGSEDGEPTVQVRNVDAYLRAVQDDEPDLSEAEITPVASDRAAEMTLVPHPEQLDALERAEDDQHDLLVGRPSLRDSVTASDEDTEVPRAASRRAPEPDEVATDEPPDRSFDDTPTSPSEALDDPFTLATDNVEQIDASLVLEDSGDATTADTQDEVERFEEVGEDADTASSHDSGAADAVLHTEASEALGFQHSNPTLRLPSKNSEEPIPVYLWVAVGALVLVAVVATWLAIS